MDLIYDHMWLLNLKEEFKNDKYVIHISPEVLAKQDALDLVNLFSNETKVLSELHDVWQAMSSMEDSVLSGIEFSEIKKGAVQLDGSKWKHLSFVKKKRFTTNPWILLQHDGLDTPRSVV